jgi:translation initiation factor 3 subunit A
MPARLTELLKVGQQNRALDVLHEVLKSRRHRNWQIALEKIVKKYLELCVEMKKGRMAKDGLIQYRMSCQAVNIGSLEDVIKHFLTLSEEKATEAQEALGEAAVGEDMGDLDENESPQALLLAAFAGGDGEERTAKENATPWIKFLWETYKTVLDILKNNSKLEVLYQDVAKRGFVFCRKYQRGSEFRKICETLRSHLANLSRNQHRANQPGRHIQMSDLSNPDTVQLFLDTRFEQLSAAMELDQWQEAYRSVEDIHGLMGFSKKAPKPAMQAAYFKALTRIFFVSGAYLFHAYAWQKLYILTKNQKKDVSPQELKSMASCVLLAALCIPREGTNAGAVQLASDSSKDKDLRMSALLGFSTPPTRQSLIADLKSKNIVSNARSELKGLYSIMEEKFLPLQMMPTLEPVAAFLNSDEANAELEAGFSLSQYVPPLRKVAVTRMLMQLSEVYTVMQIPALAKLAAPVEFSEVEMIVVEGMRSGLINIRVDHQHQCINFERQTFGASTIKDTLSGLSLRLGETMKTMQPKTNAKQEQQQAIYEEILRNITGEQKRVLSRKKIIEERKEEEEQRMAEEEDAAAAARARAKETREQQEKERVENETKQRLQRKLEEEEREGELRQKKAMIEELIASDPDNPDVAALKGIDDDAIKALDLKTLVSNRNKAADAEREKAEKKLAQMQRRLDHFERAKRLKEIPLFEEMYEKQKVEDKEFFLTSRTQMLKEHRERYEKDIKEKERLMRMHDAQAAYVSELEGEVREKYEEYKKVTEKRIADRRRQRQEEREAEERRKEAEERRLMDEVRAAQEEAQRREEAEREEERRREEMDRLAREREAAQARPSMGGGSTGGYRPGALSGRSVRDAAPETDPRGGGGGTYRPPVRDGAGAGAGAGGGSYRPPQRGGGDSFNDRGPGPGRYSAPSRGAGGAGERPGGSSLGGARRDAPGGADDRFKSSGGGYRPPAARR